MNSKIWYVSKYAMTPKYGSPTRQFFFSKYWAKLGRDVTLISSQSNILFKDDHSFKRRKSIYYADDNVRAILFKGPKIKLGFNIKRIYSWIVFELRFFIWAILNKKEKPDVLIVSSLSILTFLSGIILKKILRCKLICEVRDIYPLTLSETKKWSKNNPIIVILSIVEKLAYKYSDQIIGSMPNLKEHVKNVCKGNEKKVSFIPMGIDFDYYSNSVDHKSNMQSFEKFIPEGNFIVGYAGSIGLANCVDEIMEVALLLRTRNITFAILGDGPLKADLEEFVANNSLKNVVFFKPVPKNQVNNFLKKCDVLINPWKDYPELYKFGVSPNKWIDYLYSAKPVLVSLSGYHHIINEAQCGEFIESGDIDSLYEAILRFSEMDKNELQAMGNRGRKFLEMELDYSKLTDKYLQIIDSL